MAHWAINLNISAMSSGIFMVDIIIQHMKNVIDSKTENGTLPQELQPLQHLYDLTILDREDLNNLYNMICDFFTKHELKPFPDIDSYLPKPNKQEEDKEEDSKAKAEELINMAENWENWMNSWTDTPMSSDTFRKLYRPTTPPPLPRTKRQLALIGGAIAGILSAIAGTTIYGMLEDSKLQHLAAAINNIDTRQRAMVHLIDDMSEDVRVNRKSISLLAGYTRNVIKNLKTTQTIQDSLISNGYAQSLLRNVRSNLELYVRVTEAASNHRLAVGLVSHKAAKEAIEAIKSMALKKNLTPVIVDPHHFNQLPTSFVFTSVGLQLVVHVPLMSASQTMDLFSYTSFPVQVGNKLAMAIRPEKTLLALSSDRTVFKELSKEDLGLCFNMKQIFICTNVHIVSKASHPSCLYALYFSQSQAIRTNCRLQISPLRDIVVPAGTPNQFMAFTVNPRTFSIHCTHNNTQIDGVQLKKIQMITVPDGCEVTLPNYVLTHQAEIFYKQPLKLHHWTLPVEDWFPGASIDDLEKALDQVDDLSRLPPTEYDHWLSLIHKNSLEQPISTLNWTSSLGLGLGCFAAALVVILIVYFCIAYYKKNSGSKRGYSDIRITNVQRPLTDFSQPDAPEPTP